MGSRPRSWPLAGAGAGPLCRRAYGDLRLPIDAAAEDGEVWVRLRMQGRHTGPFVRYREGRLDQAVPPTGREIDCEQIHVLALREGRVVGPRGGAGRRDDAAAAGRVPAVPGGGAADGRLEGERAGRPGGGGGYAACCGGGIVGVTGLRGGGFAVTERSGGGFGVTGRRGREGECR
ncbi:ester cyclase [Streptomyces cellulosae]|uniref:ester cyclase n=1 Tax=unclassified Streptomyces TaxID=2593676 RepID=UPI00307B1C1D